MTAVTCARCGRSTPEPVEVGMRLMCGACAKAASEPIVVRPPRGTAGNQLRLLGVACATLGLVIVVLAVAARQPQDPVAGGMFLGGLAVIGLGTAFNRLHAALLAARP